ncbi:MAG: hypothetical protein SOZ87_02535 [Candidatus Cryptobacteroides sp.]|nr:hypothetical protein [Candidatus Cryptobacteroides sp.]
MIALPSIAFGGFSGSAKGVTARQVGGRSVLSLKCYPTGVATGAQLARRASLKKISKSWKELTSAQMADWDRLAEHETGQSSFGQKAEISGLNLYIRLNSNRVMAGERIVSDAPVALVVVPNVEYDQAIITPQLIIINGIRHQSSPFKLVVKMSGSQSSGITNGWSKTVIISSDTEDDWGEADLTKLYLKTIGVEPTPGQKVFIETYWLDTSTGFTGQVFKDSVIVTGESSYQGRVRVTMDNLDPASEQHVSALDMDFSTAAPVIYFDTVCLGHSNVASSEAILDKELPEELIGLSYALARGMGEDGSLHPQSYQIQSMVWRQKTELHFMHRGGKYIKPTEVFGPDVFYQQ